MPAPFFMSATGRGRLKRAQSSMAFGGDSGTPAFAATASAWSMALPTDSSRMRPPFHGKDAQSPADQIDGCLKQPPRWTFGDPSFCADLAPEEMA